jgi:hypothetical protein
MDAHSSTIFVGRAIILQTPFLMGKELKVLSDEKRWIVFSTAQKESGHLAKPPALLDVHPLPNQ